ncbi:MAG: thymidylate synthase [Clostridiales bacterium]|nr:thymidylate synthase [Clostridiales bacterium]
MRELFVEGKTLPEVYHKALRALYYNGEITDCPDYNTTQKECSMTMSVLEPLAEPMISRLFIGGFEELEQYRQEVLDGILNFRIGKGWDYTYNSRISGQLDFIYRELKRNPYTRRAVIDVRDWKKDSVSDSPACLQHMQFFIREGKLHMKVLMRSNDAAEATYMNAFAFIMLQKQVADNTGCKMGSYTHRANSFHCYEKDFDLLEGYVKRIESGSDTTYNYKGFFENLMIESRPSIKAKVEELRTH